MLVFGQNSISGYITEKETGEPIVGAVVYEQETKQGATSNAFGYYHLIVNDNKPCILKFSFVGYKTYTTTLQLKHDTVFNVALIQGIQINEVSVNARQPIEKTPEISTIKMDMKDVKRVPAFGGEVDLIKVMQLLPGVSQGDEGKSGMYVRGGSSDQNLILLDDAPLYYVNHLGGFVSTFNNDAINSVKLIKGGFPARYGSRLSSVMDIRMKNGDLYKRTYKGTIGLISSKLLAEGPIKEGKSSYLISGRRMMYDLLTRPITPLIFNKVSMGYTFYDLNAKVNFKAGERDHFYLSYYGGQDVTTVKYKDSDILSKKKLKWGNILGVAKWNHLFRNNFFGDMSLSYTQYKNGFVDNYKSNKSVYNYSFLSKVADISAKADFEYYLSNNYTFRFGTSYINHHYVPTHIQNSQAVDGVRNDSTLIKYNENANELNFYVENEFNVFSRLNANVGFRFTSYITSGDVYQSLEPRLSINYEFIPGYSLKAGYASMQQNVHMLTSNGLGMPNDYWLPATKKLKPETSAQYSLALVHTAPKQTYEMSIEAYYKEMTALITFKEGIAYFTGTSNWQDEVESDGFGMSKGVEFYLRKLKGKYTGWISYTLSKTTRQFDNINNGETFPFKYDRLHDVSVVLQHQLTEHIDIFASWVYHTGNAITLSKEHYTTPELSVEDSDFDYNTIQIYDGRNSFRMKDYHRLDIGINFTKEKKWGKRIWSINLYNVYSRLNPYYYFWSEEEENFNMDTGKIERSTQKLYQQNMFPFIPSVSYSFVF